MAKQDPAAAAMPEKNPDDFYPIGKVKVNLNIASGKLVMDLTESLGGLVLVSGVAGRALNAGIPTGEYHCRCGSRGTDAYQNTCAYCLEDDTAHV